MLPRYWRHVLFVLFATGFLISAPLVVLFTAGYRYNFDSGKIVQKGVLNVSSIPKGANVFVDTILQKERTPAVINNVLPGPHDVLVEKEGYTSWKKTLEVVSKQSTFAQNVILFLNEKVEIFDQTAPLIRLDQKPTWQTTPDIFQIQNNTDRTVLTRTQEPQIASIIAYLPLSQYNIETAPNPYLLLHDQTRGRIVLIQTNQSSQPILLNTDATLWAWSPNGDALLFSDGFDIEVYFPAFHSRETVTRLSQPIRALAWYPLGHMVVFSHGDGIFAQEIDRRGQPNKTTLAEGLLVKDFWFENDGTWLMGITEDGNGFKKRLQR